jgi:hypothetical protein
MGEVSNLVFLPQDFPEELVFITVANCLFENRHEVCSMSSLAFRTKAKFLPWLQDLLDLFLTDNLSFFSANLAHHHSFPATPAVLLSPKYITDFPASGPLCSLSPLL